ncbi:IS1 family transposase [Shigella flexneri]
MNRNSRGYVGAKSRQRWLLTGCAGRWWHTSLVSVALATLERLLELLWYLMWWSDSDGWPLYESRLKGKLHVIGRAFQLGATSDIT